MQQSASQGRWINRWGFKDVRSLLHAKVFEPFPQNKSRKLHDLWSTYQLERLQNNMILGCIT